jgi:hypothetical protein
MVRRYVIYMKIIMKTVHYYLVSWRPLLVVSSLIIAFFMIRDYLIFIHLCIFFMVLLVFYWRAAPHFSYLLIKTCTCAHFCFLCTCDVCVCVFAIFEALWVCFLCETDLMQPLEKESIFVKTWKALDHWIFQWCPIFHQDHVFNHYFVYHR